MSARIRLPGKRRRKYGNTPIVYDGIRFASKAEGQRYLELRAAQDNGFISKLQTQPSFEIRFNGHLICKYIADFAYVDRITGRYIVEDVKGCRTAVYQLKKKLMKACLGIDVQEPNRKRR